MSEQDGEKIFLEKAKAALDAGEDNLDAEILSRLRRARKRALQQGERKRYSWVHWFRFPVAGYATALAAVLVAMFYLSRTPSVEPYKNLEDVEILASSETLDLYADLDFYAWLAKEKEHAG